ncbi:hypothetical protein FB451DRAFT_1392907 [Mycena latifolia]|nr:hypothetical protein FB451DRAFT_1392907 [Mycena latifolia]
MEDSDDYGYISPQLANSISQPGAPRYMSIYQAHPPYYRHFLYSAIVDATARDETSLRDLPAELIIKILAMAALSSRTTGLALALTSPWIADVTLPARLAHVSLHTSRHVRSFHGLVCSSPRAAGAVRTLWIGSSIGREEDLLIPAFLTACTDIQALVCRLGPLENLCRSKEPLPPWLLSVQLTLPEFFPRVWPGSRTKLLNRLAGTTALLHNLTHLYLPSYQDLSPKSFPAQHLPRLAHLAMGSHQFWPRSPAEYASYFRYFAASLKHVRSLTSLQQAVLVFRPTSRGRYPRSEVWQTRELVEAAREYDSSILACCLPHHQFRASKFWAECVADGEDVWSLAQKQASLFSGVSEWYVINTHSLADVLNGLKKQ